MRIFLRVIAVLCALAVLWTLLFLLQFGRGGISTLLATGAFGVVTLVGWVITFITGPIAAVQLARLKSSGRIAAAILFATTLAYNLVGLAAFRQPGAPSGPILATSAVALALLVIVLSPQAREACNANR